VAVYTESILQYKLLLACRAFFHHSRIKSVTRFTVIGSD
jgi:hypothetical protein